MNACIVILTLVLLNFSSYAVSQNTQEFGQPGSDGGHTPDRPYLKRPEEKSIFVQGQAYRLDVSGYDGHDGFDGEGGSDASFCNQPLDVPYDLKGADGGHAADGGRGQDSSGSGDVFVYYKDLNDLKKIEIHNQDGNPGGSGRTGIPGQPCRCTVNSWVVDGKTYTCSDGSPGLPGHQGQSGILGTSGWVYMIPFLTALDPETKELEIPDLVKKPYFPIGAHDWDFDYNCDKLFHPQSDFNGCQTYLKQKARKKVAFQWAASRPITDFEDQKVRFGFDWQTQFYMRMPFGVTAQGHWIQNGDIDVYVIDSLKYKWEP